MSRHILAFILFGSFLVINFGLRTLHHWRATGSTGYRGISGRPGSPAWLGGVLLAISLVLGALAPTMELLGIVQPIITPSDMLVGLATLMAVLGILATYWAQAAMGHSWRVGVKRDEHTELVIRGPFEWMRNPIFSFMLLMGFGITMVIPNVLSLASVACMFVAVELQVRAVEEPYLFTVHGQRYADYCARVGRFVPGIGYRRFE